MQVSWFLLVVTTIIKFDNKMKTKYNPIKIRDFVAKDLRTPKYRMRVVESKVAYKRNDKHKKGDYEWT